MNFAKENNANYLNSLRIDNSLKHSKALYLLGMSKHLSSSEIPEGLKNKYSRLMNLSYEYVENFYYTILKGKARNELDNVLKEFSRKYDPKNGKELNDFLYLLDNTTSEIFNKWEFEKCFDADTKEEIIYHITEICKGDFINQKIEYIDEDEVSLDDFHNERYIFKRLISKIESNCVRQDNFFKKCINVSKNDLVDTIPYAQVVKSITNLNHIVSVIDEQLRYNLYVELIKKFKGDNRIQNKLELRLMELSPSVGEVIELVRNADYWKNEDILMLFRVK